MSNAEKVNYVIGEMLDHIVTRVEAVEMIEKIYAPHAPKPKVEDRDDLHWVICNKNGKVDVYHVVQDCPGGDECDLVKYLNDEKTPMDENLKRGRQYDATRNGKGWSFRDAGPVETPKEKKT